MEDWEVVSVPSWTCLLYVDVSGQYRCKVEDSTVLFHVQGLWKSCTVVYTDCVNSYSITFSSPTV